MNDLEQLPDDYAIFVHAADIARIRDGHWLTIDGEFFEVVEISDETQDDLRYQVQLKKIQGMPEDRHGYIGTFYITEDTLNLETENLS